MERVVERSNLRLAYQRVVENKGAPGVDERDGGRVQRLAQGALAEREAGAAGRAISAAAGASSGHPEAVGRGAHTGHADGGGSADPAGAASGPATGVRADVLGRQLRLPSGAQRAAGGAQSAAYIREGKRWVVDIDLEKFFDRVNHDVLMARVARRGRRCTSAEADPPVPGGGDDASGSWSSRARKARRKAGRSRRCCRTSCSTDLDRELERRGLAFCRYADDCNVYVGSRVAGERVMRGIRAFLEEVLRLRVNAAKSAVARPWERKFLGYSVTAHRETRLRIAQAERASADASECEHCCAQGAGDRCATPSRHLNPLLRGWINYFQLTDGKRRIGGPRRVAAATVALSAVAAVEAAAAPAHASCVRGDWTPSVLVAAPAMVVVRGGTPERPT